MNKPQPITRQPIMDYHDIIEYVENKYNINVRDYLGLFGGKGREKLNKLKDEWLEANGYGKYKHVLNKPEGSKEDWSKDSEEMRIRIEINTRLQKEKDDEWDKEVPYLDYWHWLLEHEFYDVHNPCDQYWNLKEILEDDKTPEWVKNITQLIYNEFNEYLDLDGGFEVHISW